MHKSKIKTGDFLFCKRKKRTWLSRLISLFTRSEITHLAVSVWIWEHLYIIDAQEEGIFLRPFDSWIKKYNYEFEIKRSPFLVQEKTYATNALSYCGSSYDKQLLLVAFPIKIFKYLLGIKSKIPKKFKNNGKFVCVEFALLTYNIPNAEQYTPIEAYKYCEEHCWDTIY